MTLSARTFEDKPKTLFFLHIPKCAGTTLREEVIKKQFKPEELLISAGLGGTRELIEFLKKMPAHEQEKIKCITGHYSFGIHEYYTARPAVHITILRDPVERLISYYSYVLRNENHYLHKTVKENNYSLRECIKNKLTVELDNGQTRILAGVGRGSKFGNCTGEMLEQAKKNLESHFSVVGLAEKFDEFLLVLGHELGWDITSYKHLNVTGNRLKVEDLDGESLEVITKYNRLDMELYRYAAGLFKQQFAKATNREKQPPPLFIHSSFRTGSTYIWNKFRQKEDYYCYYEPFHHELADLEHGKTDIWKYDKTCTGWMRHPELDNGYLNEYNKHLKPGVKGVPFFKKSFSFDNFCDSAQNSGQNSGQKEYIDFLIKNSGGKTPVLQFNRSGLRISWFKANYPETLNIYLVRNPGDQFHSYLDMHNNNGLDSFLTMDLIVTGINLNSDFLNGLDSLVPLVEYHSPVYSDEKFIYSRLLPLYSTADRYRIFYFTWFLSLVENVLYADFLLNIDLLSTSEPYRTEVEAFLKNRGFPNINFSDSNVRHYTELSLSREEMIQIEQTVQSLILKRYLPGQVKRFFNTLGKANQRFFGFKKRKFRKLKRKKIKEDPAFREALTEKHQRIQNRFSQLRDELAGGNRLNHSPLDECCNTE